ncbi:hypothetical protein PspS49_01555 [Pseudomonas sp. S49]|nr:hypothetical protein PspS49_01555 [Pseudomonas sp. S49]
MPQLFEHSVDRLKPLQNIQCFQHRLSCLIRRDSCNGRPFSNLNNLVLPGATWAVQINRFL